MTRRACLVIPRDLLQAILSSSERAGWFSGLELNSEKLFIVLGCKLGGVDASSINRRLLPHRATDRLQGEYKEQLVQWAVVEPGFYSTYSRGTILSGDSFSNLVSINFPEGRLLFCAVEPGEDNPMVTAVDARWLGEKRISFRPCDHIVMTDDPTPFARLPKKVVQELNQKSAMIVGLGSGGSEIALNLACCGIGNLELIDPDRVRPENYVRFPTGKLELGRYKVDVVASLISERELPTAVNAHRLDILREADEFRNLVTKQVDVIVCATDSVASRRLANWTAVAVNVPCVIAGTLDQGRIGEVLKMIPHRSPCYECARLELGAAFELASSDERSATPYVEMENEHLDGGALRPDISVPAVIATRAVFEILDPTNFPEGPAAYIVWGREADKSYASPFQFELPLSTNHVRLSKRKDCPVCGALPSELVGVDVAGEATEILAEAGRASS